MLWLFKKRKLKDTANRNATHERATKPIVTVCIRFQQRWADFMQRHTEHLSSHVKLILLYLFCLITGSLSWLLITHNVMSRKTLFTVTHLKTPPFVGKSGVENTKAVVIVTKTEYQKIHRFRMYIDSLTKTPSGKKSYDSILVQLPGLMDSILLIENIYESHVKK